MRIRDWAIRYGELGLPVGPAKRKSKEPYWHPDLFPHGLHSATTDTSRIDELWRRWPQANILMRCGDGRAVLDIDPRDGGDEILAELEAEHGPLPDTWTALTGGGGEHRHFLCSGRVRTFDLAPGLTLKAEGGYVIMPPSLHESDNRYQWDVMTDSSTDPAFLPDWIAKRSRSNTRPAPEDGPTWAAEWLRTPAKSGKRRGPEGLPRIVGYLRGHAIDCETAVAIVELWDLQNPVPLGAEEVRKHVEGMYKRYGHPAQITAGKKSRRKPRMTFEIVNGQAVARAG